MRKKIIKTTLFALLAMLILATIIVLPIGVRGYNMYKEVINEKSIESRIDELEKQENYIPFDQISDEYKKQVIASEDHRFYTHNGLDYIAISRATYHNIKAMDYVEGGSTITQQLAKNMCFTFEKKLERKVAEVFVAEDLERILTKDEILELYCNITYFGEDCYGLKEATNHYYDVEPWKLTIEQASALVETIKSPNNNNPNVQKI